MKIRYFTELQYKGTNYAGWQIQPNAITVQEVIEKAFTTILREPISVLGCGRTDTGVHALYYVLHFDSENAQKFADQNNSYLTLVQRINRFLPADIAIISIKEIHSEFNARFDAVSRTYEYRFSKVKNPFSPQTSCFYPYPLKVELMQQAANLLFNYTDFTSFSKLHTQVKTNNCKILQAQWHETETDLVFTIRADRFLRNMVRAIVGTLLEVGREKLTVEAFIEIIESKNRSKAGMSAPAEGLFLTKVDY